MHNHAMGRWGKRVLWTVLVAGVLLCAGLLALQRWVGSDDFRLRVQSQAEAVLGVPVMLGRFAVDPWPVPAVALDAVALRTDPPLTAQRIELRLRLNALLSGRLEVASLVVQGADLPQSGIGQLLAAIQGKRGVAGSTGAASGAGIPGGTATAPLLLLPRRLLLTDIRWRNLRGEASTIDADAKLDLQGLPTTLALAVTGGAWQGAHLQATRTRSPAVAHGSPQGANVLAGVGDPSAGPAWDIRAQHAGGVIEGMLAVQCLAGENAPIALQGQFETRDVALSALRKGDPGPLGGRLQASTTVSARAASTAGLAAALVTHSRFTVNDAVVHGLDLAKAVQTVGLSRGGVTRLDSLSGQVATRGGVIALNELVASSGALSATGDLVVSAKGNLSGRINVNLGAKLVGRAVGVPLVVAGTMDSPTVSLTRAAMVGAAIGTLVMPGVGTGAGASIGESIGNTLKGLLGK